MRKYYLMTVTQTGPDLNPGSHFITHGIRHLIRLADPEALCFEASLFSYHEKHWRVMLDQADAIFLCGNPRYDRSNQPHFWVSEIWDHFATARTRGILTGDLFAGSASPLPLDTPIDDAKRLLTYNRNQVTAREQGKLHILVARDRTALKIATETAVDPLLFPCSTWWAKDWLGIAPAPKTHNAIVIPSLNCSGPLIRAMANLEKDFNNGLPTYLVAHMANEFALLNETLPQHQRKICLSDPASLLLFYAGCSHMVSARLHATIPALSLGTAVCPIAMDGRSLSLVPFGVKAIQYPQLLTGSFTLKFYGAPLPIRPNPEGFVKHFREKIVSKLTNEGRTK